MAARLRIAPVADRQLPAVAALVFAHNRHADGAPRCLHSDQGDTLAANVAEIEALPAGERLFVAAFGAASETADDAPPAAPEGVAGAEFDEALGRAWLRAPLLSAAVEREREDEAATLRSGLLAALLAALPAAVTRLDAFVHPDDAGLGALFAHAGWDRVSVHHVMRAGRPPTGATTGATTVATTAPADLLSVHAVTADDPRAAAAMPLHQALFPTSYLPPDAMRASLDDTHRLFVAERQGRVIGYLYAQRHPADGDGYIDYLGVEASARGRGVGGALLREALAWLLADPSVRHVDLTVRTDRAEALALYARAGFARRYSGVQWRLERLAPPG